MLRRESRGTDTGRPMRFTVVVTHRRSTMHESFMDTPLNTALFCGLTMGSGSQSISLIS